MSFFNFRILDNKTSINYEKLFSDIDNKIYLYSKKALFNAKYGLNDKIEYDLVDRLLIYKRVLRTMMISGTTCFKNYKIIDVISKIKRLINTGDIIPAENNLTGCTPDECKPVTNLSINFR